MIGLSRSRKGTSQTMMQDPLQPFQQSTLACPSPTNVILPSLLTFWSQQPHFPLVPWHTPAQCNGLRFSASTASSLAPCCKQSQREAAWSMVLTLSSPTLLYLLYDQLSSYYREGQRDHGYGQLLGKSSLFLADYRQP